MWVWLHLHLQQHTNDGVQRNETIVVIDAGGGTVDAVTYKCTRGDPLRLSEEVVAPDSKHALYVFSLPLN
jgi:hypothetical protein